jgi:hypothetical protein
VLAVYKSNDTDLGGCAMNYKIKRIIYEDIDVDRGDLMTLAEAAREIGISLSTMRNHVSTGRFTCILDLDKTWQDHRLVLKTEVEQWIEDHPS